MRGNIVHVCMCMCVFLWYDLRDSFYITSALQNIVDPFLCCHLVSYSEVLLNSPPFDKFIGYPQFMFK